MPNVVWECVYCPRDDTEEDTPRVLLVIEHMKPHGEGSGPQLCSLFFPEFPLGRPFLERYVLDRGQGHLGDWGYEQSMLLVSLNTG